MYDEKSTFIHSFNIVNDSLPIMDKYPRHKDQLTHLHAVLQKNKQLPYFFIYSYKDDNFEIAVFH